MLTIVAWLAFALCVFARQDDLPGAAIGDNLNLLNAGTDADMSEIMHEYLAAPYEQYPQYDDSPKITYDVNPEEVIRRQPVIPEDLLSKEISLLQKWDGEINPVLDQNGDLPNWNQQEGSSIILNRILTINDLQYRPQENSQLYPSGENDPKNSDVPKIKSQEITHIVVKPLYGGIQGKRRMKQNFALTPFDEGYFNKNAESTAPPLRADDVVTEIMEPRKTRQNPNLSRAKSLVADNLDELRAGFTNKEGGSTDRPRHIHIIESFSHEPDDSIYGTALMAAVGAALAMALLGFAFGWYTLSKKAKAAADVDYPAYGVTGPSVDSSGDRKLAQSAHMYHYQHQKQQIMAMERGCLGRNNSLSDAESEEENEEGDYTVYECPGLATTGDIVVKNPMFVEEPTPASPAKSDADNKPKE
ncbi:uncharacterized protein LOC126978473 isoform X2 [Leptidea sinapis]|uniref:uncharacterized protein LOC126978473 isoform X2 n=1 Tax=Leptidea sinapis TaxID=189913 RepID=UPI0021235F0C|nr:uncharacterized protein LOC126978473 isoform X2 [Leptidea sinapis]